MDRLNLPVINVDRCGRKGVEGWGNCVLAKWLLNTFHSFCFPSFQMRMCSPMWLHLALGMAMLGAVSSQQLQSFPKLCDVQNFDDYLRQTGKVYSDEERTYRESIFAAKMSLITLSNKNADNGVSGFRLGVNPLADMTRKEVGTLLGSKVSEFGE